MTITLDLPRELESELSAEAKRLGLPLSEYVLHILSSGRSVKGALKTGAELVDYWRQEGLIGTRLNIVDSQEHARRIREKAEQRIEA